MARGTTHPRSADGRPTLGNETELFAAWQQRGDRLAREKLVEHYLPLARGLANRYSRRSEPLEDLIQVACVGLLNAIDRFDIDRQRPFTAFAVPTILGEMRRYFRDAGWALHVPRSAKERALEVRNAIERLHGLHGRSPSLAQIAEYLEIDVELVCDAMAAMEAYDTWSIDAPRPSEDGAPATFAETIGRIDERYELLDCDVSIRGALQSLQPRDRRVLQMSYVGELTQAEIAARLGVSQMQVSRLLRRALDQVRELVHAPPESP